MSRFHDPLAVEPGLILSNSQSTNLRLAVRSLIFSAAVFTSGHSIAQAQINSFRTGQVLQPISAHHPLIDPWFGKDNPKTDDSGGSCSPSGCVVWADPFPFGAPGATGGGGSGGDGTTGTHDDGAAEPPAPAIALLLLPDMDKVKCVVTKYGATGMNTIKFPVTVNNVYAFVDASDRYAYSSYTSSPPSGYWIVGGDTEMNNPVLGVYYPGGGWTEIYANGLESYSGPFDYTDLVTGAAAKLFGPFTAFDTAVFVTAHEVAHQNGIGTTSFVFKRGNAAEMLANGYGASALKAYRADSGTKCR